VNIGLIVLAAAIVFLLMRWMVLESRVNKLERKRSR
jgi:HAMP domain-containing protein